MKVTSCLSLAIRVSSLVTVIRVAINIKKNIYHEPHKLVPSGTYTNTRGGEKLYFLLSLFVLVGVVRGKILHFSSPKIHFIQAQFINQWLGGGRNGSVLCRILSFSISSLVKY